MIINGVENIHIQGLELENNLLEEKSIVGSFVKNTGKLKLININKQYNHLKGSYINITGHGNWYVDEIKDIQENVSAELTLYNLSHKFDVDYEYTFEFPNTLENWAIWIGNKVGVPLGNTDFTNSEYILNEQPYLGDKPSYRDAIRFIAKYAGSYIEIKSDDKFYINWFNDDLTEIIDWFELSQGSESKEINTVVLGRGDVEDNVYYPEIIPDDPTELRINDEFLNIEREELIIPIYNQVNGFKYTTFKMRTYGQLNLGIGSKVKYPDLNRNEVITYVMNHRLEYMGGDFFDSDSWFSHLEAVELDETNTDYKYGKSIEDRIVRAERITDKVSGEIIDIIEITGENSSQINQLTQTVDNTNITINNEIDGIKSELTEFDLSLKGLDLKFQNTGNNIFLGTHFRNLDNWRTSIQRKYIESDTAPVNNNDFNYWYCMQASNGFEKGQMYVYDDGSWIATYVTRNELDQIESDYIKIGENSNIKDKTISNGYLELNLNDNKESILSLYQDFMPITPTQEKITTAFGVDIELEQGIAFIETKYYSEKIYLNSQENDFIEKYELIPFANESVSKSYKIEMNLTPESRFINFSIKVMPISIKFVQEQEPFPNSVTDLWGKPSTNEVFKPKFEIIDGVREFVGWNKMNALLSQAEQNKINFPELTQNNEPFLFPKGRINFFDLKSEYGDYSIWSSNQNEVIGSNYVLNDKGFFLTSGDSKMTLSADEIINIYRDEKVFEINKNVVFGKKIKTEELDINGLITKVINVNNRKTYIRYIEGV